MRILCIVGFSLAQFHGKDVNRRGLNNWGSRNFRIIPNVRSLGAIQAYVLLVSFG